MTKITDEQKNKILQNLSAKNEWLVIGEIVWLIDKINEVAQYSSNDSKDWPILLTDERLEEVKYPQSSSSLGKAIQALRDNEVGLGLIELINYERKRRENQTQERNIYQGMKDIEESEMGCFAPI